MRARAFQSNFAMGILDEEAHGRVDLEVYVASLGDCQNGIPSTLGSVRRRAGFIDEGAPNSQTMAALLVPFRPPGGDQLQLEFGHLYMRIWEPNGAPRLSGGAPYEIATPWTADDLAGLRWDQSNDVLYVTHNGRALRPRTLQRLGDLDWVLSALENRNGPWGAENADASKTLEVSAVTGAVTVTASGHAPFTPAMVGEQIRLRTPDGQPSCASWTPATSYNAFELVQSDGKLYILNHNTAQTSGTAAPIHESGAVTDGRVYWRYLCDGAGIIQLTGYSSPTSMSAVVVSDLPGWTVSGPRSVVSNMATTPYGPSSRWAFGAWSDRLGWPGHVAVTDEERLAFSGPSSARGRYDATRSYGWGPTYADFHPGQGSGRVLDSDALQRSVKGGADPIEWLAAATSLMFGTTTREGVIQGESLEEPLTPAANRPRTLGLTGSSDVPPALAHNGVLFVERGGRGLSFLGVDATEGVRSAETALFVEDLVAERIAGLVWAANPDRVAWLWTATGALLSLTYQPRQNQAGWARHPLPGGFIVESASVITDGDGRDVVWLVVRREKDGTDQRRIWRQAARWRSGRKGVGATPLSELIYLDASRLYSGAPATLITGLSHLSGEAVRVFGNEGRLIFDAVVSAEGEVAVPAGDALTQACIGLRYAFDVESLPLDQGGPGETLGAKQRVFEITVQLADCVQAQVSFGDGPLEAQGGKPWGTFPAPSAQVFKAKVGGETTRDARWRVVTDDCWPVTLKSVRAAVNVDD